MLIKNMRISVKLQSIVEFALGYYTLPKAYCNTYDHDELILFIFKLLQKVRQKDENCYQTS